MHLQDPAATARMRGSNGHPCRVLPELNACFSRVFQKNTSSAGVLHLRWGPADGVREIAGGLGFRP